MIQINKGLIEQIGTTKTQDILYISNRRRNLWIFSLFNGYNQLGTFKSKKGVFKEGDLVIVKRKGLTCKIIDVRKDKIIISNINNVFID